MLGREEINDLSKSGLVVFASSPLVRWGRICCTAAILTLLIMSNTRIKATLVVKNCAVNQTGILTNHKIPLFAQYSINFHLCYSTE